MATYCSFLILSILATCYCAKLSINVNTDRSMFLVNPEFLSVTIDAAMVAKDFRDFDFKSPKLLTLAKGLSVDADDARLYFRLGGSTQDHIFFDPTSMDPIEPDNDIIYILNATEVRELCAFVDAVSWKLIIGLNSLLRKSDGSWDPTNAIALMTYAKKLNCSVQYELGNEPDLYPRHLHLNIPPKQLAVDFLTLREVLDNVLSRSSLLLGPDIATLTRYEYFSRFLSAVQSGVLSAVTYHHYYSSSEGVSVHNFTSVSYLDSFITYGQHAGAIIEQAFIDRHAPPIWIGETSSTYGGGSKTCGESFAAGFLWLDKLGLAAQMNISVVLRQALVGGLYSLLNDDLNPNPDYWSSVLYKRLVGTAVLDVTGFLQFGRSVRVYAHCARPSVTPAGRYRLGDIVLIALNVASDSAELSVADSLKTSSIDQYLFTPAFDSLSDNLVKLNGCILKMIDDVTLPELRPLHVHRTFTLPSLSYAFYVLSGVRAKACIS